MKTYTIKPEYFDLWGEEANENTVLTENDVEQFAEDWEMSVDELKNQLDEHEEEENVFFEGHTRTGKRAEVVLKDGKIYIVYTASGIARKWNDEYYTEDSRQLVRDSFIAEGFRII